MHPDAPRDLAGTPGHDVPVPAVVRRLAAGAPLRPVWHNGAGGLTYAVPGRHLKWSPVDLSPEIVRLRWAAALTPVPTVLDHGADDDGFWLVTATLPGRSAIECDPLVGATALGEGLRALHELTRCPFTWDTADRLAGARPPRDLPADLGVTDVEAERILADPPAPDPVVCHGDACAPNTLVHGGRWSAHVDLGDLGVGDRWADLAVATWSTVWNYGPGYERRVLDAYGIAPDPDRTLFHRLLWHLT